MPFWARFATLLVASALAVARPARADDAPNDQSLGVRTGYEARTVLDRAATSLPYLAQQGTVRLHYGLETRRFRFDVFAGAAYGAEDAVGPGPRSIRFVTIAPNGEREEVVVPMRGTLLTAETDARFEGLVRTGRFTFLLGGSVRWELSYPQGFVTPALMQLVTLRPSAAVRFEPRPRDRFSLGARSSVLGWGTRLPYHQTVSLPGQSQYEGLREQGAALRGPRDLRTVELEASYAHRFQGRTALSLGYRYGRLADRHPRPLTVASHRVELGLDVHF